ncbi:MAG: ribose 5-phosphate isomerase B [Thermodesulfobacteriota bacterium]|nr:ribose 5-phosphate isomerase B [Thermodesulfobacteriota bacterium]
MNIIIASDHAGFRTKRDIIDYLRRNHATWDVTDMGPEDDAPVDYPIYAHMVASAVAAGDYRRGILICGSGIGMSMMANRFQGVRAALCVTPQMAELSRQHNRSNVLCLAGRLVDLEENIQIVNTWLNTDYTDEARHTRRYRLMDLLWT